MLNFICLKPFFFIRFPLLASISDQLTRYKMLMMDNLGQAIKNGITSIIFDIYLGFMKLNFFVCLVPNSQNNLNY